MHTISTETDGDGYRARCSCGWMSNRYGSREAAQSIGYTHKQLEGDALNQQPGGSDDPRMGY